MTIAFKLADRHPVLAFWQALPVRHQIDTLVMMWAEPVRLKLTREFNNYKTKLEGERKIRVDSPSISYKIGEDKIGQDFIVGPKGPRNVLDFCR